MKARPPGIEDDLRRRVLGVLRRHGWNATSFQILEPGFSYWFAGDDALVAYVDTGRAWVAAGAPIADESALITVATAFVERARANGRRVLFFATEGRFIEKRVSIPC
jgi:phosphatidylglycerol lysyltransferase